MGINGLASNGRMRWRLVPDTVCLENLGGLQQYAVQKLVTLQKCLHLIVVSI